MSTLSVGRNNDFLPRVLYVGDIEIPERFKIFPADNVIRLLQHTGYILDAVKSEDPARRFLAVAALHRITRASAVLKMHPVVEQLSALDWTVDASQHNSSFQRVCESLAHWMRTKHWSYAADPFAWEEMHRLLKLQLDGEYVDEEDIYVGIATLGVAVDFDIFGKSYERLYTYVDAVLGDYYSLCK